MKAIVVESFRPFDQAELREVPEPEPGPGEVAIEVHAAEVNYPDFLVIEGNYQVKPPFPFSPGKGAAGVIAAVGAGVEGFSPGDRVATQVEHGAYAEMVLAPAVNVFPLSERISYAVAVALGLAYQTAHFALIEHARLAPGESVLVLGATGGVGVATLQLAKALGAGMTIAGTRGTGATEFLRQNGADHVIDLAMDDLREGLRTQVREVTGGGGADIVVDPVGGAAAAASLRALAWRGRFVVVGFASGEFPSFAGNYLLVKNISVLGLHWSDYRDRDPGLVRRVQAEIFELCLAGKLAPPVTRTFPLADYAEALRLLRDGTVQGRVVLNVGAE